MKLNIALTAICAALITQPLLHAADTFFIKDGDRVVFYGDSITDQRLYTVITETYAVTRYPNLKASFIHSGWGGDKVSGGGGGPIDERLKRDVFAYNPTVMTIMLGMNDGEYSRETLAKDQKYFDGMRHILDSVKSAVPAIRFTLIQPSPYDDFTQTPKFEGGYNEVLISFSKWLANYASDHSLNTADFNRPTAAMLRQAFELSPEEARKILPDRVHPAFAGHMVMAEQLLKTWGARALVSSVAIDVAKEKPALQAATFAHVSGLQLQEGAISWTETDDALPLPIEQWKSMWGAGPVELVLRSSDFTQSLNQQPLSISGLKPGVYSLKIDGTVVGTFNDDEFARGINLALQKTPMTEQAKKVYDLTVSHCDIHNERWRTVQVPLTPYNLPQATAALSAADALEQAVLDQRTQAAQPVAHHLEVAKVN